MIEALFPRHAESAVSTRRTAFSSAYCDRVSRSHNILLSLRLIRTLHTGRDHGHIEQHADDATPFRSWWYAPASHGLSGIVVWSDTPQAWVLRRVCQLMRRNIFGLAIRDKSPARLALSDSGCLIHQLFDAEMIGVDEGSVKSLVCQPIRLYARSQAARA